MSYGFIKVASAIPSVKVADCSYNIEQIAFQIKSAASAKAQIVLFPELSITGYSCSDLFLHQTLIRGAEKSLEQLLEQSKSYQIVSVVGMPIYVEGCLFNCAVVFSGGEILGVVPKTHLPEYKEFYEKRWFSSSSKLQVSTITLCGREVNIGTDLLFKCSQGLVAIEICEDLWMPTPPSSYSAMAGANIILNLSASNELIGKHQYLLSLLSQQSARTLSAYVYSSAGFGESSTDVVYSGNGIIVENGTILASAKRFELQPQIVYADIDLDKLQSERVTNNGFTTDRDAKRYRVVNCPVTQLLANDITRSFYPTPFVPPTNSLAERCSEIFNIQTAGLARRLVHTNAKGVVVGISGGLDSTLALLVCVRAYDKLGKSRKEIVGITMPGFGTTSRTYNNAIELMENLGITIREISIKESCLQHFSDINHNPQLHDITYENSQARERTQILMDVANQIGGFVIGTGDLSELALGWATYNGDHMSMYGVNGSIPKTLVKHLVEWSANNLLEGRAKEVLLDIVLTPISPELLPADKDGNIAQKTEDVVGPYILHDFFLYYFLRFGYNPKKIHFMASRAFGGEFDKATIKRWLTTFSYRFFSQQFKRSCLPDGPKVGTVSISPRGDWRMPSDCSSALWIEECENIEV